MKYFQPLLTTAALFFAATALYGNVGVFRGSGADIFLETASSDIQMVEETVEMFPMRGNFPIDDTGKNLDKMRYHCTFKLRNLSETNVTVQVGFPLHSGNLRWRKDPDRENITDIIGRYGFVAGTKDRIFAPRFVRKDGGKMFSHIFLWDMAFAPKEEVLLSVIYTMEGYAGLAQTTEDFPENSRSHYKYEILRDLEIAIGQVHSYVTGTASSWTGIVEKATFRIYPHAFEKYLRERGTFDETEKSRRKVLEIQKEIAAGNYKNAGELLFRNSGATLIRKWNPAFQEWKKIVPEEPGAPYYEKVFAPFQPAKEDIIAFYYLFPVIPDSVQNYEILLTLLKERADGTLNERNVADVILEFYGIETKNPDIQDFLLHQSWYPVSEKKTIDPELKKRLESASGNISVTKGFSTSSRRVQSTDQSGA